MAIAIDGSGAITGISVGGIPDGVVDTDVLANNAVTFGKIGTTEQGQLCKAWVNFNGTGAVAIRASYNVSSITDNGTGNYTVTFTTAMVDSNYIFTASGWETGLATANHSHVYERSTLAERTASSFRISTTAQNTVAYADFDGVYVAIFR